MGVQCTAVQTLDWSFKVANAVLILQWDLEDAQKQVLIVLLMRSVVPRSQWFLECKHLKCGAKAQLG